MWAIAHNYLGVRAGVCRRSSGLPVCWCFLGSPTLLPLPTLVPACPQEGWGWDMSSRRGLSGLKALGLPKPDHKCTLDLSLAC